MNQGKLKILHTIRQGEIGGGESHVLDVVKGLDATRYESVVLAFTDGAMIDTLNERGVKTYVIPTLSPFDLRQSKEISNIIRNEQIDLVHAHGSRAMSNSFIAAKKAGIPIIYTVHGWSFHQDQSFFVRKLRELSEWVLTRQANLTICVSKANQTDGITRFNMQRSTVIYNGVDTQKFNPNVQHADIGSILDLPKNKTIVGYIARITKQKDPITLLKAISLVAKQTDEIFFLLIGDGDLKEKAIAFAQEANIMHLLKFEDFRQDIPDVLHAIDIYVLPSLWEGLPFGALEAMAMQKACIATPVDGTKEIIEDKKNGLFFDCQDEKALANNILLLHKDTSLRAKLAQNALQTITTTFDQKTMVSRIEQEYQKLTLPA